MGVENLGVNWTCDSCLKTVHTDGPRPEGWTRIDVGNVNLIPKELWSLCDECWSDHRPTKPKVKKKVLSLFLEKIGFTKSEGQGDS